MNISWWESSITSHQIYPLLELNNNSNVTLAVYTLQDLPQQRKASWSFQILSSLNHTRISLFNPFHLVKYLRRSLGTFHIFGGPFDSFLLILIIFVLLFFKQKVYILTEPYCPLDLDYFQDRLPTILRLQKFVRLAKHKFLWFCLKGSISGVFVISTHARDQLLAHKLSATLLYPFCYFVRALEPVLRSQDCTFSPKPSSLRCVFVGNQSKCKGFDVLLDSFARLLNAGVVLDVYSFHHNTRLNYPENVYFKGEIEFGLAQHYICKYDLLILPSRYDGWGVVVNEAIHAGVPVLCTSSVGASTIVRKYVSGIVLECLSVDSIMVALLDLLSNPTRLALLSSNCKLASASLQAEIASQYIQAILSGDESIASRIVDLWY